MSAWTRVFQLAYLGFALALFIGVALLIFSARLGVLLALVGFGGYVGMHLVVGIVGYRQTMRRPWPKVPPVEDDDEW